MFKSINSALGTARLKTCGIKLPLIFFVFGSNVNINDGTPITNDSSTSISFGSKGYLSCKNKVITVKTMAKSVFIRKIEEEFCTLLMTCLPSFTTFGSDEKLDFKSTSFEIDLATSLPSAIAIEQSASFKARVSLTPSPVIATTLPLFFSAFIIVYFCSGVTLPKTVNLSAICSTSLVDKPSKETYLSLFSTPTR